jgi:hypothetical protein
MVMAYTHDDCESAGVRRRGGLSLFRSNRAEATETIRIKRSGRRTEKGIRNTGALERIRRFVVEEGCDGEVYNTAPAGRTPLK